MNKHAIKYPWLIALLLLSLLACRLVTGDAPTAVPAFPTQKIQPTNTVERFTPQPTHPGETPPPTEEIWPTPTVEPPLPAADYGPIARRHLSALSEAIGRRVAGTAAETKAAGYIQDTLEEIGYTVERQPFSFEYGDSANVIAVKPGISPVEIIVGAHYDSVDTGKGADDNASGVAALLEAAQWAWEVDTPYTIRFIAFGSEEENLDGSSHYAGQMSKAEIKNTLAYINLDSLVAGDFTYIYGDTGPGSLRDWILEMAQANGFDLRGKTAADLDEDDGAPCDCADYSAFQEIGIPFAYFEATNWETGDKDGWMQVDPSAIPGGKGPSDGVIWHTHFDAMKKLDELFPGRIDAHLKLFVTLLVNTLTQFGE